MNKLQQLLKDSELAMALFQVAVYGCKTISIDDLDIHISDIPEEFIELDSRGDQVVSISNLLGDFEVISNDLVYIDGDPHRIRIVSFDGDVYQIATYHDSWNGSERPGVEDIIKGKLVPKTLEVFEADE